MKRRRKRGGLSGTGQEHAGEADGQAIRAQKALERFMTTGSCPTMYNAFFEATQALGKARGALAWVNDGGSAAARGAHSRVRRVEKELARAFLTFRDACVR